MTRFEAIAKVTAMLPRLSDQHVQALAEIAESWDSEAERPAEDEGARAAIAEGIEQARRGEFASEAEVAEAYARFRR